MTSHKAGLTGILASLILITAACAPYNRITPYPYTLQQPAILADSMADIPPGNWKIYPADSPDLKTVKWEKEMMVPIRVAEYSTNARPYYVLVDPMQKDTLVVSNRLQPVDNVLNFRDLGGIRTVDGKRVKWGKIYRSGHLGDLKSKDFGQLEDLHITHVVDLRTTGEMAHHPDQLPADSSIAWVPVSVSGILFADIEQARTDIRKQSAEEFDGHGRMIQMMDTITVSGGEDFRKVFDLLLSDSTDALLYHCTAGKDRTGLMTTLILSSLGVSDSVIMQDYLLSNYYRYDKIERFTRLGARFLGIENESIRSVLEVRPEYLQASYAQIQKEYGSLDQYLRKAVGLTTEEINRLKERYLE
ncbi:tyrosine-protein phosphatase [bacterium SCSIO 12741]|nr:tyrosine-protein phosphatase [bacterium SCSIO 12741]